MSCCGKIICTGCVHAFQSRATKKEHKLCPFCRSQPPPPKSDEKLIKRVEVNDADAMVIWGVFMLKGSTVCHKAVLMH